MTPDPETSDTDPHGWQPPPGWRCLARGDLPGASVTDRLAAALSDVTGAGDMLLLSGELGAGKTHFARAFIRHAMGPAGQGAEVPSPSFTLVQTYATHRTEIWHADLYRLTSPDELPELGLDEAMEDALCLVEWPERLAPDWPETAVLLRLEAVRGASPDLRRIALWAPAGSEAGARVADAMGRVWA